MPHPDERVLDDFLRLMAIAQHSDRSSQKDRAPGIVELPECIALTLGHPMDQCRCIARLIFAQNVRKITGWMELRLDDGLA
ncbi:MAG: hypothetical protein ACK5VX_07775, partial [Akkermansiaceae bacterium]